MSKLEQEWGNPIYKNAGGQKTFLIGTIQASNPSYIKITGFLEQGLKLSSHRSVQNVIKALEENEKEMLQARKKIVAAIYDLEEYPFAPKSFYFRLEEEVLFAGFQHGTLLDFTLSFSKQPQKTDKEVLDEGLGEFRLILNRLWGGERDG